MASEETIMNPIEHPASTPLDAALALLADRLVLHARHFAPDANIHVAFEAPRRREFGDFATNIAFGLAKATRTTPQMLAEKIVESALADPQLTPLIARLEATAGFINVRFAPTIWQQSLGQMLLEGGEYGKGRLAGHPCVSLEFGSANPTGPLVVVQGRTLSIGATLARAFAYAGVPIIKEWITNDAGNQLETFGHSIYARYRQITEPEFPFPEKGYPGEYVLPIALQLRERDGDTWEQADTSAWLPIFSRFGRDAMVADQQKICARFGVTYDLWQSEKELHDSGAVERGIAALTQSGLTYESEGALWFSATKFGDDKDRVLKRSDGRPTYYAGDVAYHHDKYARGATQVVDILGPDHHGYIGRLKALAAALGHPDSLDVLIVQQMTLMRGTEPVSLSKRSGNLLTLEEVIDEVGVDAARFFFILSSTDSPLTFDLELAKRTTEENPVFYVQYGHARIASILRKASPEILQQARQQPPLERLTAPSELALIARLAELPGVVATTATTLAPHRLAKYARDVAGDFHQFYADQRILSDDPQLSAARLALAIATKQTLATVLEIVGVSTPEEM